MRIVSVSPVIAIRRTLDLAHSLRNSMRVKRKPAMRVGRMKRLVTWVEPSLNASVRQGLEQEESYK